MSPAAASASGGKLELGAADPSSCGASCCWRCRSEAACPCPCRSATNSLGLGHRPGASGTPPPRAGAPAVDRTGPAVFDDLLRVELVGPAPLRVAARAPR